MNEKMKMNQYLKEPIEWFDDIPVFSKIDNYTENYHKIASDHVSRITNNSENPWIRNEVWDEMELSTVELIQKYLKGVKQQQVYKILDVGVGLGRLLQKIRTSVTHANIDAYGMDIAMPYLERAMEKGINVCFSRIEDMPYLPETFDLITCTDVLEHVIDLNACLQKIIQVLIPGGILFVRVPYRENLSPYLQTDYPYELAHLRNFDEYSLELLFTRVFKLKILEFCPGLFQQSQSHLKYKLPIRGYNGFIHRTLKAVKLISKYQYDKAIRKMFYPVEINVVLQKPLLTPEQ